ncbi:CU044_5270 family protein [Herbidospora daliensis]|uniref:CU044_5270 family protein n=1 Tax=Herbidospora daliensis TaxID=295585 RepID=UPI000785AA64|nr:CU044_5270 family protein [Herbidospora daliensis]
MSDIDHLVKAIDPAPHAPEPGPGARELREAILSTQPQPRRTARRRPWRAGAIGLAAAAAATALLLDQVTPTAPPSPPAAPVSILLVAAAKAEAAPTGAYWHLKESSTGLRSRPFGKKGDTYHLELTGVSETWAAEDGRTWTGFREIARPSDLAAWRRDGSPTEWPMGPDGGVYSTSPGQGTFFQNGRKSRLYWSALPMTLKEIQALPTDPEALKERALEAIRRDDGAGPPEAGLPRTLASLLYELPASPQVRSAAYRALATLPGVRVDGPATDPQGRAGVAVTFLIQGDRTPPIRLIIDPGTSKVLTFEVSTMPKQEGYRVNVVLESGWTNAEPAPSAP